jgi:hypothetical protein
MLDHPTATLQGLLDLLDLLAVSWRFELGDHVLGAIERGD